MKVYEVPSDQSLDRWNDMPLACGRGHIIPPVQALAREHFINLQCPQLSLLVV